MLEVCTCPHGPFSTNAYFDVTSKLLLDINDVGHGDSPCLAGATTVLDCILEVLSEFMMEQLKV